jgi:hypothetical protein
MTDGKFYVMEFARDGVFETANLLGVKVVFLRTPMNQNEVQDYLEAVNEIYARKRKFLILYDASRLTKAPTTQMLSVLGDDMKRKEELTKAYAVACSIVIAKSKLGNILLPLVKGLIALQKPACPTKIFNNDQEASAYLASFNPNFVPKMAVVTTTTAVTTDDVVPPTSTLNKKLN